VAIRQQGVESVSIYYRRTREEMPAYEEEIEAALQEGIHLETLVSPVRVLSRDGRLTGIELLQNRPGKRDASGRRYPVPVPETERQVPLDTLIVAISEAPEVDAFSEGDETRIEMTTWGTVAADAFTLATSRPGVFAGGDAVTGPNTVVDAIAAGKRVARMIERYLSGADLQQPLDLRLPKVCIEPASAEDLGSPVPRADLPRTPVAERHHSFVEVELSFSEEQARQESRRCLRCDLEFTRSDQEQDLVHATEGGPA